MVTWGRTSFIKNSGVSRYMFGQNSSKPCMFKTSYIARNIDQERRQQTGRNEQNPLPFTSRNFDQNIVSTQRRRPPFYMLLFLLWSRDPFWGIYKTTCDWPDIYVTSYSRRIKFLVSEFDIWPTNRSLWIFINFWSKIIGISLISGPKNDLLTKLLRR
jgi:hypothetical protein